LRTNLKTFPFHPATLEMHSKDGRVQFEIQRNFNWWEEKGPDYSHFAERDLGGDGIKNIEFNRILNDQHGFFQATTPDGIRVIVRPYDEYDPVRADISRIPWPKSVIQDVMMGEAEIMLNALVDDNGDVATLMLDTPSTSYLRYTGAWYLMPDVEAISDYDIVMVEDEALDMYDPADQTGKSVKITSMPIAPEDDFRVQVRYSGEPDADALKPLVTETIVASLSIPTIASARDLPAAIEFAQTHPDFQWYVERRARSLGIEEGFPWND